MTATRLPATRLPAARLTATRRRRGWGAAALTLTLLPVITVRGATAAAAVTHCPAAPAGISSSAPGTGRTVALTFDDGPGKDTRRILATLAAYHVTATFFNLGMNEARDHATVRAEHAAGYALGDHTWDHHSLPKLDSAGQAAEIDRELATQASLTGAYPCTLRPPYGNYDATTLRLAQQRHLRVWNWSVDTEDWKAAGSGDPYWVERITARADEGLDQVHPVILMHNQTGGNPATVAALPRIISYYRAHRYTFVDVFGNTGPPTVRSVSPASGRTAGGLRVAIKGTGFAHVSKVTFGSYAGTGLRVASSTTLYITTPRHPSGLAAVRVITDHGTSVHRVADQYRYVSPPTVTSVSPASGRTAGGGTRVTVTGANFSHVIAVTFGSAKGRSIRVLTAQRLTVTAPAHIAGTANVHVISSYGRSAVRPAGRYTYVAPLTVSRITPTVATTEGATLVTVTGTGFVGVTAVTFNGVAGASFTVRSAGQLVVRTAAHQAGLVDVQVRTNTARSPVAAADRLTFAEAPVSTLTATATTPTSIALSWRNPGTPDLSGVMVRRAPGATAPESPAAGDLVTDTSDGATTLTDTGLVAGTTYSYALFAHDGLPNYAPAATTTASTATE